MFTTHLPPSTTTRSYIHLRPQMNKNLDYDYDSYRKRKFRPYFKFQTGSTTTFSGYTNINNNIYDKNKNENCYNHQQQQQQINKYNANRSKLMIKYPSTTNNYTLPHRNNDAFRYPPQKNRRTLAYAQQFQNRNLTNTHNNNDQIEALLTANKFNGLILSDSMCKHIRTEELNSKQLNAKLSYESGCTCDRMIQFLNEQTEINNNDIFESNFIVYSLCTNDVANIGAVSAIRQCRELINLTRELFPKLKKIGWIALSPRTKPSRLYTSDEIGKYYHQFNQLLAKLGKEMNFDIIYANLQVQHLHIDGLHPSISSGRNLIEKALSSWFTKRIKILENPILNEKPMQPITTTAVAYRKDTMIHNNNQHVRYNDKDRNYIRLNKNDNYNKDIRFDSYRQQKIKTHHHENNNNNKNEYDQTSEEKPINLPGRMLIPYYPHFLRHKEEFFRKIKIPEEFEKNREDIFLLSNLHFQTEYFKSEADKWKVYMTAANNNKNKKIDQIEPMEIIIEEENNNSIPIARPSIEHQIEPPAPLDFTEFPEIFDEWLPEPAPGQKRKLGHRRDDPPTPPSPRHPPPIIPRRALPPRDPSKQLKGGSLQTSPSIENSDCNKKQQQSFNALIPIEKNTTPPTRILLTTNEPSIIISPMQSSTPEPQKRSPSVIPKNPIEQHRSFNFSIIPIECRYHFKKTKQRCTIEAIKIHQEFLENKYRKIERETESELHSKFPKQIWTKIVELIKEIVRKPLENKKNSDKRRIDNLTLDQIKQEAILDIEKKGTTIEQRHVDKLHEKFMRKLDLQLQLDKLETRFLHNIPPPSLNLFDKLELYAKELKVEDNQLKSLREQWRNILRKTKLDLTSLMRQAKLAEIREANKQYEELEKQLVEHLREPYNRLCHVTHSRHNQIAKKKLNFLLKKACIMREN